MPLAFLLLNVDLGLEDKVKEEVAKLPQIVEAYRVFGVYDSVVKINAESQEAIKAVVSRVRKIDGVRSTMTMVVVE